MGKAEFRAEPTCSARTMSATKRPTVLEPASKPLKRVDSDLSDKSEDSDGEGPAEAPQELGPTHDKHHPKHSEDWGKKLESRIDKFKQNYPFNRKAIPSLLSSDSPFHNYRGFLHLSFLLLVRFSLVYLPHPPFACPSHSLHPDLCRSPVSVPVWPALALNRLRRRTRRGDPSFPALFLAFSPSY